MRAYEFDATVKLIADESLTDTEVLEVKTALGRGLSMFGYGVRRGNDGYGVVVVADRDSVLVQEVHRTAAGKALRDEDFEALADEAERGYDVSHLRGEV